MMINVSVDFEIVDIRCVHTFFSHYYHHVSECYDNKRSVDLLNNEMNSNSSDVVNRKKMIDFVLIIRSITSKNR